MTEYKGIEGSMQYCVKWLIPRVIPRSASVLGYTKVLVQLELLI